MTITTHRDGVRAKSVMANGEAATYEWTHEEAQRVALAEIFEHAGGASSAAYKITAALFAHYSRRIKQLEAIIDIYWEEKQ